MAEVDFCGVNVSFPTNARGRIPVLQDFTLRVQNGEFLAIFGPNGSGKSTLLNAVAGLISIDSGSIHVNGNLNRQPRISFIFQNYRETLLPWSRVIDNVAYPLYLAHVPKRERRCRVLRLLDELKIALPVESLPGQLSGGQQQLLAIARALIVEPDVMLLDEPFSALDIETRIHMQQKLEDIWIKLRPTVIFVSHELDEALLLADRVVILSKRPARPVDILEVPFARPRSQELLEDERFFEIRKRALKAFRETIT